MIAFKIVSCRENSESKTVLTPGGIGETRAAIDDLKNEGVMVPTIFPSFKTPSGQCRRWIMKTDICLSKT